MLQNIIKKSAQILNDNACLSDLSRLTNDQTIDESSPVKLYISLVNFVMQDIAKNFKCFSFSEYISSDLSGQINLSSLDHNAYYIKTIKTTSGIKVRFSVDCSKIYNLNPTTTYLVEYFFYPSEVQSIEDTLLLPFGLDYSTICYGVVYEYLVSKMQLAEAEVYKQKYILGLKILNHKYYDSTFRLREW